MLRAWASSSASRLLGRGEDVRDRSVDDHHAELGRSRDVDVVEADAGASDHHEVARGVQRRGVDLGGRANDQRVRAGYRLEELGRRQAQSDVDLVTGVAQLLETGVSDLFGN